MITHRVTASDCLARQTCNYHKCHRCIFRGQAIDWQPGGHAAGARAVPGRNGVAHDVDGPQRPVELPRPEGRPTRRRAVKPSPV